MHWMGFEPMKENLLVPETSAFDHFATSAKPSCNFSKTPVFILQTKIMKKILFLPTVKK